MDPLDRDTKRNVLGVRIDAVERPEAVALTLAAARRGQPFAVSALATHGVMTGALDPEHRYRLNRLDLVCADGQPVRWALNRIHGSRLGERVYGPDLMLDLCAAAAEEALPIFLYGTTPEMLIALERSLKERFPKLVIAGSEPSRFRPLTPDERDQVAARLRASGAAMVFVGLGCPRQEVFAYEMRARVGCPLIAIGAAFAFHAGFVRQAPKWMQRHGLEWLFRLGREPRLWRRYLFLNPAYAALAVLQWTGLRSFSTTGTPPTNELRAG